MNSQMCPIVITLEDSIEDNKLLESINVILTKNGKVEADLYIRDSHSGTRGPSISKDNKVSKLHHSASVKLRSPKDITGEEGIPIKIYNNRVVFDEKEFPELSKVPDKIKKLSKSFLEDNVTTLNAIWDNQNSKSDIDAWKSIIDKSYKNIKSISGVPKEVNEYLDTKKKGNKNK